MTADTESRSWSGGPWVLTIIVFAVGLIIFSLLLPTVDAPGDRRRIKSNIKLININLTLLNYFEAHGHYPADIKDENGKPILSWRVAILPYMDQSGFHRKFDLTKSWYHEPNNELCLGLFDY